MKYFAKKTVRAAALGLAAGFIVFAAFWIFEYDPYRENENPMKDGIPLKAVQNGHIYCVDFATVSYEMRPYTAYEMTEEQKELFVSYLATVKPTEPGGGPAVGGSALYQNQIGIFTELEDGKPVYRGKDGEYYAIGFANDSVQIINISKDNEQGYIYFWYGKSSDKELEQKVRDIFDSKGQAIEVTDKRQ